MDGECSCSCCAICSIRILKDITRKVERDTFPDLKKAPVGKKQKYVPSIVSKKTGCNPKPFAMSDFDSKVILVGLKSDLKNDEETKKKLAEKEKVKVD